MELTRVKKFKKMLDGYANLMDDNKWFWQFHIKYIKHHERSDKFEIGGLDHEDVELTLSKKKLRQAGKHKKVVVTYYVMKIRTA